ncbi:MAG: M48 family metallopeptidase [Thermoflexibacter sp.]|jgi:Zn-dependent protease with chaperone function|nr:M48 family metallopeptidase [Thermoflexibacter sp.]
MNSIQEKKRIYLKGIDSTVWEHPADRAALKALQNVPALDTVIKSILSPTVEKSIRLATLASAVKVSEKQFSKIYSLHQEACRILDIEKPDLFIAQNPVINAYAVGWNKPFIVLNTSLIQALDNEEVLGVIGHELGHIKSGHMLYKTLLSLLIQLSQLAFQIPLTGLALQAVIVALREWDRKSELSADRAEALTTQNPDTVIRSLMKMAGGNRLEEMDLGEFIKQAEEYQGADTISDNIHKLMNTIYMTHPFPVVRVLELINWVRSGEYDVILRGTYSNHRKEQNGFQDFKDAAKSYQEEFKKPMESVISEVKGNVEDIAKKVKEGFDNFTKKGK